MSNPITTLPEEGVFVSVTDNGTTVTAAYWNGHWRDVLADGGWLDFSESATWDEIGAAPVKKGKASPAPATEQP